MHIWPMHIWPMHRPLIHAFASLLVAFVMAATFLPGSGVAADLSARDPASTADRGPSHPDDIRFSVAELSPDFVGDADAVVRLDRRVLDIEDEDEAVYRVHRAVTIFSADGRDQGRLVEFYDEFREIDDFDGSIRDASGAVLRDVDDDDIRDVSLSGGASLQVDTRAHIVHLTHSQYPYTVEYEYEIQYEGYFHFPTWRPQTSGQVAVERSYFVVEAPAAHDVRYRVQNGPLEFEERVDGDRVTREWSMKLQSSVERPPHSPSWSHVAPAVHVAPTRFELSGYTGRMHTWEAMSQWFHRVHSGRQTLPPSLARRVDEIVAASTSKRETIEALYRYMQDRTRYISIQLGIGGLQPFPAKYVHERGYGDCKALTNYLWAMLEHAGIDAMPALIYMDRNPPPFVEDFSSFQFNHEILAVPMERDTLWLEATSQTLPFAHVHSGIADRPALLVTPDGGTLVRTPSSTPSDNRQIRRAHVTLSAHGDGRARMSTTRTGVQTDAPRRHLATGSPEEVQAWMRDQFDVPGVSIHSSDVSHATAREPDLHTSVEADLPRVATVAGSRMFVPLTIVGRWTYVPRAGSSSDRHIPVRTGIYPYVDVDSTTFVLPDGYAIESLPDSAALSTRAGSVRAYATDAGDGTVTYVRKITVTDAELPPDAYGDLRALYQSIAREGREQMVLVEK